MDGESSDTDEPPTTNCEREKVNQADIVERLKLFEEGLF